MSTQPFVFPKSNAGLNIPALTACFANTTSSYKYLWFWALLEIIEEQNNLHAHLCVPQERVFAKMVTKAWAPRRFYKLSFGFNDGLSKIFEILERTKVIEETETRKEESFIFERICHWQEKEPRESKKLLNEILGRYVPYKFLSPWIGTQKDSRSAVSKISFDESFGTPYFFNQNYDIVLRPEWMEYFHRNHGLLIDFVKWNFCEFLQSRNPSVPAIVNKLAIPNERDSLVNQKKYWAEYIKSESVLMDMFGQPITEKIFDLDHFIPWSFVAHNQIWNLIPMNHTLNIKKSNHIPSVDRYVEIYAEWHFGALEFLAEKKDRTFTNIQEEYASIGIALDTNLQDIEDVLRRQLKPLEITALNSGFKSWTNG